MTTIVSRFCLVTATAIVMMAVAANPAEAQSAPELVVDDGSEISETGVLVATATGLEPGTTVFLLLCNSDEALGGTSSRCALVGAGSAGHEVDPYGTVRFEDVPLRPGRVGSGAACPPSFEDDRAGIECVVVVSNGDQQELASARVNYRLPEPVSLPMTGPSRITNILARAGFALIASGSCLLRLGRRSRPADARGAVLVAARESGINPPAQTSRPTACSRPQSLPPPGLVPVWQKTPAARRRSGARAPPVARARRHRSHPRAATRSSGAS